MGLPGGREGSSFALGLLGTTCLCLPKCPRWVLVSISPCSIIPVHVLSFPCSIIPMILMMYPWDAHHTALHPQCPPSAVPDPTILAAPNPPLGLAPCFLPVWVDKKRSYP